MSHEPTRLFDLPKYQLKHAPQERAFNTKINGKWIAKSTQQYVEEIDIVSNALIALGVKENDKVALVVEVNCVEWHILDMAVMQIGGIGVPLYATLSTKDCAYVLNHSDAVLCFVSTQNLFEKIDEVKDKTDVKTIWSFDDAVSENNWSKLLDLGKNLQHQEEIENRKNKRKPEDIATIVYTSGTTGVPKGVMLTHESFLYTATMCGKMIDLNEPGLHMVSYLPISHVFERLMLYFYQYNGFEVYFAESLEKLVDNLKEIKPVFMPIVPRLLEKIFDKIIEKGHEQKGIKKAIFFWATRLAENTALDQKRGLRHKIADKLIYSKWREIFGGEIRFLLSGSAALQPRLLKAFSAAGLTILEGYGMTESSSFISTNSIVLNSRKIGTVGIPLKDTEVKIAEDGEILVKGINVFLGYYKNEEKTKETIVDGYLHTGDIGELDEDGLLKITDRKKEMFKTSGGKYIAPAIIENIMKQSSFIEQIMVIGEGHKMPAALIQVNYEFVEDWAKLHNHQIKDITTDEKLINRIQEDIDQLNSSLGKWERVKKFEITPDEWTIEAGHLTPTLKLRRKIIKEKYKDLFTKIYGEK